MNLVLFFVLEDFGQHMKNNFDL